VFVNDEEKEQLIRVLEERIAQAKQTAPGEKEEASGGEGREGSDAQTNR